MKQTSRFLLVGLALAAMLLSACGGTVAATNPGGSKQAIPVQYTGVLESVNGTQWVVNGQTITVDPSVVSDGPFQVGDTIKVEVVVNPDGSITVSRVEAPSATDLSVLPPLGDDNSNNANSNGDNTNNSNGNNDNSNNANSNDANSNDSNSNVSNSNDANSNDAGGSEIFGTVEVITDSSITIDGQTFNFQAGAEIKGDILVGAFVKIHLEQNADGTVTVRQVELSDPSQIGDDNSNNANSNNSNSNDDNSNSANSNDNNSKGGNDDNGGGGGGNGNGGGGGGDDNGGGGGGGDD
jgi:uncharacterized membrane protein YgcG